MSKSSTVAIDGPVAAGKSAVGSMLAIRLGYRFIDTGMMYRAVTLAILRDCVDLNNEAKVTELAMQTDIEIIGGDHPVILVDGEDMTNRLRSHEVEQVVSHISHFSGVRQAMVSRQQKFAENGMIIMAGRDIGTVVLPNADLKLFLTASPEERARRRCLEMEDSGVTHLYDTVLRELIQRDKMDTERANSPLRPAEGAHILNTDDIDLDQVVIRILNLIVGD